MNPDEDYDLFLKSYSKNIFRFINKPLSFTEKKIPELGILTIDLDFREIYKNSNENDFILLDTYIKNQSLKYKLPVLKNTCKKYELKITGKKNELQDRLKDYFDNFLFYYQNIDKIILQVYTLF